MVASLFASTGAGIVALFKSENAAAWAGAAAILAPSLLFVARTLEQRGWWAHNRKNGLEALRRQLEFLSPTEQTIEETVAGWKALDERDHVALGKLQKSQLSAVPTKAHNDQV